MVQIFISHTKKDKKLLDKFDNIFAGLDIARYRSEFDSIPAPHWKKIKQEINKSNALFFLVGRQLVKMQENHDDNWDRTQNWIAFEIGIACQREIDVWVICDKNIKINFPIPYVSAYIPKFDAKKDNELIKTVVSRYKLDPTWMPKCISSENDKIRTSLGVKCPQDDLCGLEFNMVADLREGDTVLCPHCLRPMRFVDGFPFREEKANLK